MFGPPDKVEVTKRFSIVFGEFELTSEQRLWLEKHDYALIDERLNSELYDADRDDTTRPVTRTYAHVE